MNTKQAVAFIERHGIVLQAARGPVPSLAEAIAGEAIRGSWWSHAKGREIFRVTEGLAERPDVLVCKLVEGKISYVHRRLWPALVRLAGRLSKQGLARVSNEHTESGAHRSRQVAFPKWVPGDVMESSAALSIAQAEEVLSPWNELWTKSKLRKTKGGARPKQRAQ